jgi:hypothetical protein
MKLKEITPILPPFQSSSNPFFLSPQSLFLSEIVSHKSPGVGHLLKLQNSSTTIPNLTLSPRRRLSLRGRSPSLRAGGLSEPEAGAAPEPEAPLNTYNFVIGGAERDRTRCESIPTSTCRYDRITATLN